MNLPIGTSIIVRAKNGERHHGALRRATADAVSVDSDERAFPGRRRVLRDMAKADVREVRRYSAFESAAASAAIGAAVGAGIGAGIDLSARTNEDQGLATALFTFLGGLLGLFVGRHTTMVKGDRVYVAP